MANTLRQLVVNLTANTASFIGDLDKAANAAKRVGRDIQASFSKLGSIASTALAPFGAMGSLVASSLGNVGSAIGKNLSQAKNMGGVFKASAAGVTAALGTIAAGAVGLTLHTINSAAALGRLSQQTGVSVEALSGLGFAAKRSGLDQEAFVAALGKMNKAVFAAATAPEGTKNAFTRLGVSVKDASGNVRDTQAVFVELADKFSKLPDGPVKSALAMQLFGKSGAQLIPMLNKGRDGINDLLNTARELGITLDGKTVAAAQNVRQAMGLMSAAGDGLTNKLMVELLPAFNAVATSVTGSMKQSRSGMSSFVEGISWIVKTAVSAGGIITSVFATLGNFIGKTLGAIWLGISDVAKTGWQLVTGDFKGAAESAKSIVSDQLNLMKAFGSEVSDTWSNYAKMSVGVFSQIPDAPTKRAKPTGAGDVDISQGEHRGKQQQNPVTSELAQLQEKLRASRELLAVADQDEETQRKSQAAAEANTAILKLGEQIARQKGVTTKDYASLVDGSTQATIRNTFAEIAANKAKADLENTLAKATRTNQLAISQATDLFVATQQGGEAVERANALAQAQNELRDKGTTQAQIQARAEQILWEARAKDAVTVQQSIEDAKFELDWQQRLNTALLQGADAYSAVELAREQARIDRGKGTPDQKDTLKKQAETRAQQSATESLNQSVSQLVNADNDRLNLLRQQRAQLASMQLSPAVLMALQQVNAEIASINDKIALTTGSAGDGFNTFFDQLARSTRSTAQEMYDTLSQTFNELNQQLTNLLTGQKTNWESMFRGIAQHLAQSGLQRIESSIAKALGFGKADGSKGSPYHVIVDNPGFSTPGANNSTTSTTTNAAGQVASSLPGIFGRIGGFASRIFGSIGKLFGGFFANGGDPDPYKLSVVGENGPELFSPGVRGHITSNKELGKVMGNNPTYVIDARGTNAAEVEMRVRRAMAETHQQSVSSSIAAQRELDQRRPARSRF